MKVLRPAEVVERIGLSRATIWRLEREGDFPRKVVLSKNSTGYFEHELNEWLANRQLTDAERHTSVVGGEN